MSMNREDHIDSEYITDEQWERIISWHRKRSGREVMQEMYGSWLAESEEERKLRELAETYHARCDAYDKGVCSGTSPRTGEAIPLFPEERRAINRYALDQRNIAIEEGRKSGFTREQVETAIRNWTDQVYPPPAPGQPAGAQPAASGGKP